MNQIANYIEKPHDAAGTLLCAIGDNPVVIRAQQEGDTLWVIAPGDFDLSAVDAADWLVVNAHPGAISNAYWAELILDTPGLPEWAYEAARQRRAVMVARSVTKDLATRK